MVATGRAVGERFSLGYVANQKSTSGKKLVTVIEPVKPISEMSDEEIDRLADHLLHETARLVLEDGARKAE